jgi:hypothetical protein
MEKNHAQIRRLVDAMADDTTVIAHGNLQNGCRFLETVTELPLAVDRVTLFPDPDADAN